MEPISEKVKDYLKRKLEECEKNLRKQKKANKNSLHHNNPTVDFIFRSCHYCEDDASPSHFSTSSIVVRRNINSN
jgi:hypothetical protein